MPRPYPQEIKLTVAAFAAAVGASLFFLIVPVYSSGETLVEHEGAGVLAVLALPVLASAAPLLSTSRRRIPVLRGAAAAVVLFALITGFTVGMLYAPSALLMVLAARAAGRHGTPAS